MADYAKQTWVDNDATRQFNATRASVMEQGIYDASKATGGFVGLDSFSGATDSDKLAAFRTYATAQTYKPTLVIPNRLVSFTSQFTLYSGFRMVGAITGHTDQVRSGTPIPNQVNLNIGGNNGWLVQPNGNTFGVYIGGIAFQGNSTTRFLHPNSSAVIWTSVFDSLSFNLFLSVFGSTSTNQAFDATSFTGWWNINNSYDRAITMGGSDNSFWLGARCLLDSPTGTITGGSTGANTHIKVSSMSKSNFSGLYITGEKVRPIEIAGGSGQTVFTGCTFEGRNAGAPSNGAIVKISGDVTLRDCWTGFGMADTTTAGQGDLGIIHITSGNVLLDGCWYERATGVAEDTPWVYVSGGTVRITNAIPRGFTGKPIVSVAGGTVTTDDSVTVVDATAFSNTAEGGTNTTAVTTSNSGGTSGNSFSNVDTTSGTLTFSSTQKYKGALSYKVDASGTGDTNVYWTTGATRQAALRFYIYIPSSLTAGTRVAAFTSSAGTNLCAILLNANGKLSIQDTAGTTLGTTTNALATSTWYRVELKFDSSGGSAAGTCDLKTYLSDGLSEDANLSLAYTGQNFGTSNVGRVYFGKKTGGSAVGVMYLDDLAAKTGTTSFIGPTA